MPFTVTARGLLDIDQNLAAQLTTAVLQLRLAHADQPLAPPMLTPELAVASRVILDETIFFDIEVSNLPQSAALHLELLSNTKTDGSAETLAFGCLPLFSRRGALRTGAQRISLYRGAADVHGFVPQRDPSCEHAVVELELPQFDLPVVYPSASGPFIDDKSLLMDDSAQAKLAETAFMQQTLSPDMKSSAAPKAGASSEAAAAPLPVNNTGHSTPTLLEVPAELAPLVSRLCNTATGVRTSDRRQKLRKYKRAFTGGELVTWLEADMGDAPRGNAMLVAQRLLRLGVVRSADEDPIFSDSPKLYSFGAFTEVRGSLVATEDGTSTTGGDEQEVRPGRVERVGEGCGGAINVGAPAFNSGAGIASSPQTFTNTVCLSAGDGEARRGADGSRQPADARQQAAGDFRK